MYSFIQRCSVWLLFSSVLVMTGCQKEASVANTPGAQETIAQILRDETRQFVVATATGGNTVTGNRNPQAGVPRDYPRAKFTFLTYALARTGLMDDLARAGAYTLFAPTDDAFRHAGFQKLSDLNNVPEEMLTQILLYHVIAAKVSAAQVPAGPNAEVAMLNAAKAYVTSKPGPAVYINGVSVIIADIMAVNGVIHVIDRILFPPVGDLVQTAVANPDFSFLVAAVLRASQGNVNVAAVLSSAGPYTVFAPTNQAFRNAGFASEAAIASADPAALIPILTYHVIAGRIFSSDLTEGLQPAMLGGGTTLITLAGGPMIKGNLNATASSIIRTDIVATNGVVHVIDQVLRP